MPAALSEEFVSRVQTFAKSTDLYTQLKTSAEFVDALDKLLPDGGPRVPKGTFGIISIDCPRPDDPNDTDAELDMRLVTSKHAMFAATITWPSGWFLGSVSLL
jgi:hypothetical protein